METRAEGLRDDAAAVQAVLAGETEAFEDLVRRYQDRVMRLAYGMTGNEQDAYEIAQETFLSAYRALGKFRGGSSFSTWLYRIAANKCLDFLRKRGRGPLTWLRVGAPLREDEPGDLFEPAAGESAGPEQGARRREISEALSRALGALPGRQRAAFSMHTLQGMPLAEVAQVLGCRTGTVKAHLSRAMRSLRKTLTPWSEEV